jgi:hypothetical protein
MRAAGGWGPSAGVAVGALLGVLLAAGTARADAYELSARPFFETRYGATAATPSGVAHEADSGFALGGGAVLGLGLSFAFTATARYLYDHTGDLRGARADGLTDTWSQQRHTGLVGLTWAPGDWLTPVFALEAGLAFARAANAQVLDASGMVDPFGDRSALADGDWRRVVVGRANVGLEWRFSDFLSVSPNLVLEHADGLSAGVQVWFGLYRYL